MEEINQRAEVQPTEVDWDNDVEPGRHPDRASVSAAAFGGTQTVERGECAAASTAERVESGGSRTPAKAGLKPLLAFTAMQAGMIAPDRDYLVEIHREAMYCFVTPGVFTPGIPEKGPPPTVFTPNARPKPPMSRAGAIVRLLIFTIILPLLLVAVAFYCGYFVAGFICVAPIFGAVMIGLEILRSDPHAVVAGLPPEPAKPTANTDALAIRSGWRMASILRERGAVPDAYLACHRGNIRIPMHAIQMLTLERAQSTGTLHIQADGNPTLKLKISHQEPLDEICARLNRLFGDRLRTLWEPKRYPT